MKLAHLKFFERLVDYWNNDFFYRCRYYFSSDCIAHTTRNHKNIDVRAAAITLLQWIEEQQFEEIKTVPLSERVLELGDACCHQIIRSWVSHCEGLKEILRIKDGNIHWNTCVSDAEAGEMVDYIASRVVFVVRDARDGSTNKGSSVIG